MRLTFIKDIVMCIIFKLLVLKESTLLNFVDVWHCGIAIFMFVNIYNIHVRNRKLVYGK